MIHDFRPPSPETPVKEPKANCVMGRLNQAGIPVFVLYGNHDAESQITRPLTLPDNVRVFGARKAETFQLEERNVALHGQSFRQKAVTENLVPSYPAPVDGAFNIGVLHTALGGMGEHANYAPCSLSELVAKGYEYWALGHVHTSRPRSRPSPPATRPRTSICCCPGPLRQSHAESQVV